MIEALGLSGTLGALALLVSIAVVGAGCGAALTGSKDGGASLQISTRAIPAAMIGTPYSASLAAAGGSGSGYIWTLEPGAALPGGLDLEAGGVVYGTPAQAGTFVFRVNVLDLATGMEAAGDIALVVDAAPLPIMTAPALGTATEGTPYIQTQPFQVSGGTAPYTWSVSGALPAGTMRLDSSAGASALLTGIADAGSAGTYSLLVSVADLAGATVSSSVTLVVAPSPLTITTISLPAMAAHTMYDAPLQASGGAGGYSWSIVPSSPLFAPFNDLPPGMALSGSAIRGAVSHSASGAYSFSIKVTDAAGDEAGAPVTLTIAQAPLEIVTATVPDAYTGSAYGPVQLDFGGGQDAYEQTAILDMSWHLEHGSLPAGLNLSSDGVISGQVDAGIAPGNFLFTVRLEAYMGSINVFRDLTLRVLAGPLGGVPAARIQAQGASLQGYEAAPFAPVQLTALDGQAPLAWSVANRMLPTGLALTASGVLQGTPAPGSKGWYRPTIQVRDARGLTSSLKLYIAVNKLPDVEVLPPNLPGAFTNIAYPAIQLDAHGGLGAGYVWSLASGALPPGMTLSSDGVISGAPNLAASTVTPYDFSVRATDSTIASKHGTLMLQIPVAATVPPLQTLDPAALPPATQGVPYSYTLTPSGGTGYGYSWELSGFGFLPQGLTLNSATGVISGTIPAASGAQGFIFRLRLHDARNTEFVLSPVHSVLVAPMPATVVTSSRELPIGRVGRSYGPFQLEAQGGLASYTWSAISGLPAGMTLSTDGVLSGTPAAASSVLVVEVTDGSTISQAVLSMTVATTAVDDIVAGNGEVNSGSAQGGGPLGSGPWISNFDSEGALATDAKLGWGPDSASGVGPCGVDFDASGNAYIAGGRMGRVFRADARTGVITTIAHVGDLAMNDCIYDIAVASDGTVYMTAMAGAVYQVPPNGTLEEVCGIAGHGGFTTLVSIELDRTEQNLYIASAGQNVVYRVPLATKVPEIAAGQAGIMSNPDLLCNPIGLAIGADNNVYIASSASGGTGIPTVKKLDIVTGQLSVIAGGGSQTFLQQGGSGPATSAQFPAIVRDVEFDKDGNLYVAGDYTLFRIEAVNGQVTGQSTIRHVAGLSSGADTYNMKFDPHGALWYGAEYTCVVRRISNID